MKAFLISLLFAIVLVVSIEAVFGQPRVDDAASATPVDPAPSASPIDDVYGY